MALVTQLSVIALPGSPPNFGTITEFNESGQVNLGMQVSVTDIQPNYNESGQVNIGMGADGGESYNLILSEIRAGSERKQLSDISCSKCQAD